MPKRNPPLRFLPVLIMVAPVLAFVQSGLPPNTSVTRAFSLKPFSGVSLTTSGSAATIATGYAELVPLAESAAPYGLAIISLRQNDTLISETAIPPALPLRSGRTYAEVSDLVDTGVAIANPNDSPVALNFYFSNETGSFGAGSITIGADDHVSAFLDDRSVFNGPPNFQGTFSFTASAPIAATAVHARRNERGEFLMSTLPVIDTDAPAAQTAILPHFAEGGGWTTQILLVNPTDAPLAGALEFLDDSGFVFDVALSGASGNVYSIPARSSQKLVAGGFAAQKTGSIRILATAAPAPVPLALFSYKPGSTTVSETILTGMGKGGSGFCVNAESASGESGSAQTAIAVANPSPVPADVTLELFHSDGSNLGLPAPAKFILPPYGHTAKFLFDIFPGGLLPVRFQGTVRISTTSAAGISPAALRTTQNDRGDFLIAATPPVDESLTPVRGTTIFAQFADGGGYTTRFVVFNGAAGGQIAQGTLKVMSPTGSTPLSLIPIVARSSGSMAIATDGNLVMTVNPDSGSVSAIDTATDTLIAEIPVGKDPRCVAFSPDDRQAFVTSREGATLTIIDTATLRVRMIVATDGEPYGVVIAPSGNVAYVASAAQNAIDVIRISGDQARIVSRIIVGPKPKGLALSSDGSTLFVTHFLSGDVTLVSTSTWRVTQVIATGTDSNMVQKIAIHPGNHRAYLPHLRSNTTNSFLLFDNTVFPVVSVLDVDYDRLAPTERVDLSIGAVSVNMPVDVAFSEDGARLYSVNMGSADLAVVDLQARARTALIDVGDAPIGIVISADGRKAYVNNSLSDDVSVVDLEKLRVTNRIPVTRSPLPALIHRGKVLFFSSHRTDVSRDHWMSCASCHFDGEQDGRTWKFPSGPRNTTSLRGVADTLPLHWSADRDEIQDFEFTIRTLQAGTGLIAVGEPNQELSAPNAGRSPDLDALAAYVLSLPAKPSPYAGDVDRGRAIFNRPEVGCATCHVGNQYTDSTLAAAPFILHDVGTGDGAEERLGAAFDTPSLRGIWDTAPYLHDGSAPTLRDVLVTRNPRDRHGRTSQLSEAEISDLIAFLKSL